MTKRDEDVDILRVCIESLFKLIPESKAAECMDNIRQAEICLASVNAKLEILHSLRLVQIRPAPKTGIIVPG